MITVFTHGTPNGAKIPIALEEMGLSYKIRLVDLRAGEGQTPAFLALNPAGKIPVIRDEETGTVVYESNAILLYLADKSGKLVPTAPAQKWEMLQLLFLQASLQGPMFGQRAFFSQFAPETVPFAIKRYEQQGETIDALVERLLADRQYFLGESFSIVDVSFYGWYQAASRSAFMPDNHPNLNGWFEHVGSRPAVRKGIAAVPTVAIAPRKRTT